MFASQLGSLVGHGGHAPCTRAHTPLGAGTRGRLVAPCLHTAYTSGARQPSTAGWRSGNSNPGNCSGSIGVGRVCAAALGSSGLESEPHAASFVGRQRSLLTRTRDYASGRTSLPSAAGSPVSPASLAPAGSIAIPSTPGTNVQASAAAGRRAGGGKRGRGSSGSSSSSGSGEAAGGGSPTAAAGAAVSVAVVETEELEAASIVVSGSDEEGSELGSTGNILPFPRYGAGKKHRALVLDCAYRPINVVTWYKAFHFDYFGKGEVLEYYPPPAVCTTGAGEFPLPAVLRVPQYTADMTDLCSRVACTRRNVMVRDGFCCQYCGSRRDLTIDHVQPVSKGGKDTWDNLVTACQRCNQKKSDRSLRDLGWKLKRTPKEPTPYEIGILAGVSTSDILRPPAEWELYIAPYREKLEKYRRAALEAGLINLIEDD